MIAPEFSRPVAVSQLHGGERQFDIVASEAEKQALAKRFGVLNIQKFEASIVLWRLAGANVVRLKGKFTADVVQACVVTLEPVPEHVEEEFTMTYAEDVESDPAEVDVDFSMEDAPEPLVDGAIDIGEATAEHLSLALDPFPRAPGAIFERQDSEPEEQLDTVRPFAALTSLKKL